MNETQLIDQTRSWLEHVVIGLGLCPFAPSPYREGRVRLAISIARDLENLTRAFLEEAFLLQATPQDDLETTLLIAPYAPEEFELYWDWAGYLEEMLKESELDEIIQLATFHPRYIFAGENPDELSHFTNRSPWPIFHLLRAESIAEAAMDEESLESLIEENKAKMDRLGKEGIVRLWRFFLPETGQNSQPF